MTYQTNSTPEPLASNGPWRCFHCDELLTTEADAILHFGKNERHSPACQIDIAKYRTMEERMHRYNEEDSDLHREMHAMSSTHQIALRREEERGYARGLRDAVHDKTMLRKLVDIVWNTATESTVVPDTPWADRLIAKALSESGYPTQSIIPPPAGRCRNSDIGTHVDQKAKELYIAFTNADPLMHSNRFPSWAELRDYQKETWHAKAKEALTRS